VKQRGRKSAALKAMGPLEERSPPRLQPSSQLSEAEFAVFTSIVSSVPPEHFQSSDEPLLIEYATAVVQARRAAEALRRDGDVVDGKPSPWLVVQEKSTRAMVSLSLRLRLSPQARREKAQVERPLDWFDEQRLKNCGRL
jgi:phage terminase small subunit